MNAKIYCNSAQHGVNSFFVTVSNKDYYLFSQDYRRSVALYYGAGVRFEDAIDYSKSRNDRNICKTMAKLPAYIRYVEKEYGVVVYDKKAEKRRPSARKSA